MKNRMLLFTLLLSLSGCALLDDRDYYKVMKKRFGQDLLVPEQDFETTDGDSGQTYRSPAEIYQRVPGNSFERKNYEYQQSIRDELMGRESDLSESEFYQYNKIRPHFGSDSERIYFLGLSRGEREEYLRSLGVEAAPVYEYKALRAQEEARPTYRPEYQNSQFSDYQPRNLYGY